jgi:hypothetical protein
MNSQNGQSNGLISDASSWLAHPFVTNGSALNWILFVGLLVIAGFFWNYVLLSVMGRVSEI